MLEQGGDDEMSDILCRSNPVHRQTGLCCQGWFSHTAGIQRGCIPLFRRTHYMILGNPFPHFEKSIPLFLEIHSLVSGNPLPRFRKLISSFWKIHTSILRNSFPDFRWPILWFWEIPYLFSGNPFPCFRKLIPSFQEIHFLMFRNPSPILRNPFPHFRKSIPHWEIYSVISPEIHSFFIFLANWWQMKGANMNDHHCLTVWDELERKWWETGPGKSTLTLIDFYH